MRGSFTLLETLSSIIILSIAISGFVNIADQSSGFKNHNQLIKLQNEIVSNSFYSFNITQFDIELEFAKSSSVQYIDGTTLNRYSFSKDFTMIYYDISYNQDSLQSRTYP